MRSFSGCHPYNAHCIEIILDWRACCVDEVIDEINDHIARGICPRCRVKDLSYPAGSRITRCRCVPICGPCGSQETEVLYTADCWPVSQDDHDLMYRYLHGRDRDELQAKLATIYPDGDGVGTLLAEDGVAQIKFRPNPGGWAEFGWQE